MAVYDLERLNVLVVEDNAYIRVILRNLLRRLGFGHVEEAPNGTEAIEFFKHLSGLRMSGGPAMIDIVVSDLLMSPMNGMLLLRWLRTAKESPNRMIPFIMLSGAADREYVEASRDLGVTEFLAKPFSVNSVYRKMLEVIERPRQFVMTQTYFGPDRRRRNSGPPPEQSERRVMTDEDVTVVYSAKKVSKPKSATEVWHFRMPNALKDKVGGLGTTGPGELPLHLLEEAEGELQRAALDFTEWARTYLGQLSDLCAEALATTGPRNRQFEQINLLAHELRGQGGTFGYTLITTVGKRLYECTGEGCREDDNAVEVVKAHVDTMRAVLHDKVTGDGGEVGQMLLQSLEQAVEKHLAAT